MHNKEKMWEKYVEINPGANTYDAWAFGGPNAKTTDLLAQLVLNKIKTATAGAYESYIAEGTPLPKSGGYNIILNSLDDPVCITKTTKVYKEKFKNVTKEHARKEGEGDLSLVYWQNVHKEFFTSELLTYGKKFSEDIIVVCEEFELVYPIT